MIFVEIMFLFNENLSLVCWNYEMGLFSLFWFFYVASSAAFSFFFFL